MNEKLIEELEGIRIKLTRIYMELGNPDYVSADMVLISDIYKLRKNNAENTRSELNSQETKGYGQSSDPSDIQKSASSPDTQIQNEINKDYVKEGGDEK